MKRLGLGIHKYFRTFHCLNCFTAHLPSSIVNHLKKDGIPVSQEQATGLEQLALSHKLITSADDLMLPTPDGPPVEGLKVEEGYRCNLCSFAARAYKTVANHWSEDHRDSGSSHQGVLTAKVQNFFPRKHHFFSVKEVAKVDPTDSLFDLHMRTDVAEMEASTYVAPPSTPAEVPPLLKLTGWHTHLEAHIGDKIRIAAVRNLVKPMPPKDDSPLGRVAAVVDQYMTEICNQAEESDINVRCCLMEYPRTSQNGDYWAYLVDPKSRKRYGQLLQQFVLAVLRTLNPAQDSYRLPLTELQQDLARALLAALSGEAEPPRVPALHALLKTILLRQANAPPLRSKWHSVLECLFAVVMLEDSGNFRVPINVTQTFAQTVYHIRGGMLFEAWMISTETGCALIQAVHSVVAPQIVPGVPSPYNAVIDYQRFASTLAMNTAQAPATRVSEDGETIVYKGTTLEVTPWRLGMRASFERLEGLLSEISLDDPRFTHTIPENTPDDWTNSDRGYSWLHNGQFTEDKRMLLKHMLADPNQKLCSVLRDGTLAWNVPSLLAFMRKAAEINRLLSILAYLTAGQTPRMAEYVDHKIANSFRPRTVFLHLAIVWLILRRTKWENLVRHDTFIPIKCHKRLSNLFARYLLFVRPVEIDFAHIIWADAKIRVMYQEFLWVEMGKRVTPEDFSNSLRGFLVDSCGGVDAGGRDYRQLAVAIARTYLGSEFEIDEEEEDILSAQRAQSLLITRKHYAPEVNHLPSMTSELLLRYGRMSDMWHEVTGFKEGTPPMIPLAQRRRLLQMAQ
ncbi:hypothetical protein FPV67DRAFT_1429157, partial [Lyophyllum atratum]